MSSQAGQETKRLRAIAGMLGSDHEGERANAARLATIELRRLGLTWADLVDRAFSAKPAAPQQEREPKNPFQDGWEPFRQHPDWAHRAQPREEPAQRRYTNGRRWANRYGLSLYDFSRRASILPQLTEWERRFLVAFVSIGPGVRATENQWTLIRQIAIKLGVQVREEAA